MTWLRKLADVLTEGWLADILFGCAHRQTGAHHRDAEGDYTRCMSCGARVPIRWDDVGIRPPRGLPKIRPMKARRGVKAEMLERIWRKS